MIALETLSSLVMLSFSSMGVGFALLFIGIVIFHQKCHTITILLALNSAVAGLVINFTCASQAIYPLIGNSNDSLCAFRGYIFYTSSGLLYHTLFIQALHRLFINVFATKRFLQSTKFVVVVVCIQWLFSNTFVLPIYLSGRISYLPGSQMCLTPLTDTFGFFYLAMCIYIIPLPLIILCYVFIVQHMRNHSFAHTNRPIIFQKRRQERDISILRRILIVVIVLFVLGFPYCIFWLYATINRSAVSYGERVGFIFISIGFGTSTILLVIHTDEVKKIVMNGCTNMIEKRRRRRRRVVNVVVVNLPNQIN